MLSIKLKKEEIDKLKLLLHDIELLQKQNNLFDNEAIEILSFKVIEHISNVSKILELPQQEISDEEIWKASINYDNGAFSETPIVHFQQGAFWYREQLKTK